MRRSALLALVPAVSIALYSQVALAATPFTVSDIKFNGLVRLSANGLYPNVAVSAGETATDTAIASSIKALYDTGNFSDIQARQAGSTLVFDVVERPIIASVELDGNKVIPKEALTDGLKRIGISEGQPLNRPHLSNYKMS